ncbi:MAG: histidine phosphatase family protein [Desulfovibrionaceae bacterium]|nr:histidine phosphatase family protein [Desulfovibrionaceae bacterium]MBF0514063.1 histidine phosphatase family protein [Desulfovibrionaceae bacterium]
MRIYLARCGQTISNRKQFILGRDDSPLTRSGRDATKQLAAALAGLGAAGLVCSPLGRAVASAAIYGEILGLASVEMPELIDLHAGQFTGKSRKFFIPAGDRLRSHWEDQPAAGESYADAEERAGLALELLAAKAACGPVLAVGHLAFGRVLLQRYLGIAREEALMAGHPKDAAYVLEDGEVRWLRAGGGEGRGLLPYERE